MSRKYKFGEKTGAYFISFATVYWIDVFTRVNYFDIIIESLDFCRKRLIEPKVANKEQFTRVKTLSVTI